MARKSVTLKNRDVMEAAQAMAVLTSQRWSDSQVALYLGRSFRALREASDDIEKVRTNLVEQFAVCDEDGGYKKDHLDGSVRLTAPAAFNEQWRALLAAQVEVSLYPVKLTALIAASDGKGKPCKQCNRPRSPEISMHQLEALVYVGALLADEQDDDDDQDDDARPAAGDGKDDE